MTVSQSSAPRLDLVQDDARQRGLHERDVRKEAYDRGATPRIFRPGDKVLLRTPGMHGKLEEAWEGPYEVTETLNDVNVRICLPGQGKKNKVVHVKLIVPYEDRLAKVCRIVLVAEDDGCDLVAGKLVGDVLGTEQEADVSRLAETWKEIFTDAPGLTSVLTHAINTECHLPIRSPPYAVSAAKLPGVRHEIGLLCRSGIIVPSRSPWSSPIVPILKPDGSIRLCVDYRKLNSITVPDPYYMPLIDELILKVAEIMFLSKLDMSKGFYHVALEVGDREKTAFVSPVGKFEFVRMPFGLRNAPAMFQLLMDVVLGSCCEFAVPYIDDVLVFSPTWECHMSNLAVVLGCLKDGGLTAKPIVNA